MARNLNEIRALWDKHGYPHPRMKRDKALRLAWAAWSMSVLMKEIRKGNIQKAKDTGLLCIDCGDKAQVWEHRDYTKPLQIEPCCVKCNSRRGKAFVPSYFPEPTIDQLRNNSGYLVLAEKQLQASLKRKCKPPKVSP